MPFPLEAALQLVRAVARHRRDDALGRGEGGLERRRLAGADLLGRALEDHGGASVGPGEPALCGGRRRATTRFSCTSRSKRYGVAPKSA